MIKIKNTTTKNIQFEEIVFDPGINFIERERVKYVIEKNPTNSRRFKTLISQGKLEVNE